MAVQLIAHPFRLGADGSVQTHEADSEPYLAERIALIIGTQPGERVLVPGFGISDPTYSELALPALQNQVAIYNIPVKITEVHKTTMSDQQNHYRVTFERDEDML